MKELTLKLYVTNVLEQITGMNLVNDIYVRLSGAKLVAGKDVKMPVIAVPFKETDVVYAKVASLFDDCFVLECLCKDLLVQGVEGLMFIGDSDRTFDLAKAMKVGHTGLAAEPAKSTGGFRRAFWSVGVDEANISSLLTKVAKFLNKGAAPKPEAEPESEADKPAEATAEDASPKPVKPKKAPKPEPATKPEPADEPEPNPAAEPAAEPESEAAPAEAESEESGSHVVSLLELYRASQRGETAVAECRRLCRKEGIDYDLDD